MKLKNKQKQAEHLEEGRVHRCIAEAGHGHCCFICSIVHAPSGIISSTSPAPGPILQMLLPQHQLLPPPTLLHSLSGLLHQERTPRVFRHAAHGCGMAAMHIYGMPFMRSPHRALLMAVRLCSRPWSRFNF